MSKRITIVWRLTDGSPAKMTLASSDLTMSERAKMQFILGQIRLAEAKSTEEEELQLFSNEDSEPFMPKRLALSSPIQQ